MSWNSSLFPLHVGHQCFYVSNPNVLILLIIEHRIFLFLASDTSIEIRGGCFKCFNPHGSLRIDPSSWIPRWQLGGLHLLETCIEPILGSDKVGTVTDGPLVLIQGEIQLMICRSEIGTKMVALVR